MSAAVATGRKKNTGIEYLFSEGESVAGINTRSSNVHGKAAFNLNTISSWFICINGNTRNKGKTDLTDRSRNVMSYSVVNEDKNTQIFHHHI